MCGLGWYAFMEQNGFHYSIFYYLINLHENEPIICLDFLIIYTYLIMWVCKWMTYTHSVYKSFISEQGLRVLLGVDFPSTEFTQDTIICLTMHTVYKHSFTGIFCSSALLRNDWAQSDTKGLSTEFLAFFSPSKPARTTDLTLCFED